MDVQQMTDVEFWKELKQFSPEQCLCVQAMVESGFTKEEALKEVKGFAAMERLSKMMDKPMTKSPPIGFTEDN